ncbi:MAG: hypothetical protein AB7T38_01565 [Nitrospirales bacterium]
MADIEVLMDPFAPSRCRAEHQGKEQADNCCWTEEEFHKQPP